MNSIDPTEFAKVIDATAPVAGRAHIEIIECLHLIAGDNTLRAVATNLDLEVAASCEMATAQDWSVSVRASDLRRLAKHLSGPVRVGVSGDHLEISDASGSARLGINPDAFPRLKSPETAPEVRIDPKALGALRGFAAKENLAWSRAGVSVTPGGIAATDESGVIAAKLPCETDAHGVIPAQAVPFITKALSAGGRLFVGDVAWRAESEGLMAIGKLIDAEPIPWGRLEVDAPVIASFAADDFTAAVDRAGMGRCKAIFASGDGERITISGERYEGPPASSSAQVPYVGDPFSFPLSVRQTDLCLSLFSGAQVEIRANDRLRRFSSPDIDGAWSAATAIKDARTALPQAEVAA